MAAESENIVDIIRSTAGIVKEFGLKEVALSNSEISIKISSNYESSFELGLPSTPTDGIQDELNSAATKSNHGMFCEECEIDISDPKRRHRKISGVCAPCGESLLSYSSVGG